MTALVSRYNHTSPILWYMRAQYSLVSEIPVKISVQSRRHVTQVRFHQTTVYVLVVCSIICALTSTLVACVMIACNMIQPAHPRKGVNT
jgi:hypothetical protein